MSALPLSMDWFRGEILIPCSVMVSPVLISERLRAAGSSLLGPGLVKGVPLDAFPPATALSLGSSFGAPIDAVLPDLGLPRGVVVELSAPRGLARATSLALATCAAAQAEARLRGTPDTAGAFCAWIEPSPTLFAPAVHRAGVDLTRLLVVRPNPDELARTALRVAESRAFAAIVIDTASVPGVLGARVDLQRSRFPLVVRRLAIAIEGSDTTLLLLTCRSNALQTPLPVGMRIVLERPNPEKLSLFVAKDRRGRVTENQTISLRKSA